MLFYAADESGQCRELLLAMQECGTHGLQFYKHLLDHRLLLSPPSSLGLPQSTELFLCGLGFGAGDSFLSLEVSGGHVA